MDFTIVTSLIAALCSLVVGFFVYARNKGHTVYKACFWMNMSIGVWNLQTFALYLASLYKPSVILITHKIISIPSFFVLPTSAWLIFSILDIHREKQYRRILELYFAGAILITTLSFFPGFSDSAAILPLREGIGPLYFIFIGYLTLASFYNFYIFYHLSRNVTSFRRQNQLNYAFIGLLLGLIAISIYFVTLIYPGFPQIYFVVEVMYISIFAWAIMRYKLMDIGIAWRYVSSYAIYVISVSAILMLTAYSFHTLTPQLTVLIFLSVILIPYLQTYLSKTIKPVIFGRYMGQLDKIREDERIEYTSFKLASNLISDIYKTMPIGNISVFLLDLSHDEFRPIAEIDSESLGNWQFPLEVISKNDTLIHCFSASKTHLLREDIPFLAKIDNGETISNTLRRVHAELALPIFIESELRGFLFVGAKKGGKEFHEEDIRELHRLTKTLEMHLSHSMFMEERALYSRKLSHDMKNLVHKGLVLTAQLMEDNNVNKSDERKQSLLKQIRFLDRIMQQFFDMNTVFCKILSRKYTLESVDIVPIINEMIATFYPMLENNNIQIQNELSNTPKVLGNQEDIAKVFHNLLDNSLKFTQRGHVKISSSVEKDEVLFKYEDTGIGIDKERLDRIWEPFYRVDSNQTSGLGLTIIREIIEAHKGKIRVESEKDKGTTFFFTLQIAS